MNWMTRYTNAIQNHLPPRLREDVGQEIQSLLEAELEDLEEMQGRPATEEEVLGLIKRQGAPLLVASRYQQQRVLIGEAYFPYFLTSLRYLAVGLAILYLGMTALHILVHGGNNVVRVLWGQGFDYLHALVVLAGCTTLLFHLVERYTANKSPFSDWDPKNLPSQNQIQNPVPYTSTLFDAVICLLFLGLINGSVVLPWRFDAIGLGVDFVAPAKAVVPLLNLLLGLSLIFHALNLIRPYWAAWKRLSFVLVESAFAGVFLWLAMLDPILVLSGNFGDKPELTDLGLRLTLVLAAVILGFDIFGHLRGFLSLIKPTQIR